jgi:hypothetical protein
LSSAFRDAEPSKQGLDLIIDGEAHFAVVVRGRETGAFPARGNRFDAHPD